MDRAVWLYLFLADSYLFFPSRTSRYSHKWFNSSTTDSCIWTMQLSIIKSQPFIARIHHRSTPNPNERFIHSFNALHPILYCTWAVELLGLIIRLVSKPFVVRIPSLQVVVCHAGVHLIKRFHFLDVLKNGVDSKRVLWNFSIYIVPHVNTHHSLGNHIHHLHGN